MRARERTPTPPPLMICSDKRDIAESWQLWETNLVRRARERIGLLSDDS